MATRRPSAPHDRALTMTAPLHRTPQPLVFQPFLDQILPKVHLIASNGLQLEPGALNRLDRYLFLVLVYILSGLEASGATPGPAGGAPAVVPPAGHASVPHSRTGSAGTIGATSSTVPAASPAPTGPEMAPYGLAHVEFQDHHP
ncbi:hypothetical protein H696_04018 [Fonticula alba]|uniref:Uncharacterized protein n=1 Tax=Fonticula alba TaxID=691883 RepID=A0A058Z6Q0_FONAL|nr:hypothetical protein H696_04018 [Fonticula alba]KCV69598.1 hypothetical protein H696_04018 [Fonticula alba]|eukprot:XP_009496163.1 hypothetical protein H696_04018 [Fonticula alba]